MFKMKKALSLVLAFVMCVSLFANWPMPAFATEGESVVQEQPAENPLPEEPVVEPSTEPTAQPTVTPEPTATVEPATQPTEEPVAPVDVEEDGEDVEDVEKDVEEDVADTTPTPSVEPTATPEPTAAPTPEPTAAPTATPSVEPSTQPTEEPVAPVDVDEDVEPQVGDKVWIKKYANIYKDYKKPGNGYTGSPEDYEIIIYEIITDENNIAKWYDFQFVSLKEGHNHLHQYKYVEIADTYVKDVEPTPTLEPTVTPEPTPAQGEIGDSAEGVTIKVNGLLPKEAELKVEKVAEEVQTEVNKVTNIYTAPSSDVKKTVYLNATYSIDILNNGKQWQPGEPVTVTLNFDETIPSSAYVEVTHIFDSVDAIIKEVEDGEYESFTQAGLSAIYPEETAAALAAGCPADTIVYEILASSTGGVQVGANSVTFTLSSFSDVNITASNTELITDTTVYSTSDDKLAINKKAEKAGENDISDFKLMLEAYATGEEIPAPVDVVMVLDQSTSMFNIVGKIDEEGANGDKGMSYAQLKAYAESHSDEVSQEGYYLMRLNMAATYFKSANKGTGQGGHIGIVNPSDMPSSKNIEAGKFYVVQNALTKLNKTTNNVKVVDGKVYNETKVEDKYDQYGYMWFPVRWKNGKLQYNVTCLDCFTDSNNGGVSGTEWNIGEKFWIDIPSNSGVNTTNLRFYKTIYGSTYDAMMEFYNSTKNVEQLNVAMVGFSEGGGIYNATVKNGYSEDIDLYETKPFKKADAEDLTTFIKTEISSTYGENAFTAAGSADLLARIKNYCPNYYGTVTDAGFALANYLFKNPSITGARTDAKRFVIVYTDGNPVGNLQDEYDEGGINDTTAAIEQAYITKNTHKATVYAIAPPSNVGKAILSCLSSEYPQAKSTSNKGTENSDGVDYAIAATSTAELKKAFQNLAQTIAQAAIQLGSTTVIKDVITDYFELPDELTSQLEGKSEEDALKLVKQYIKVYTADYKEPGDFPEKVLFNDAKISLSKDENGDYKIIKVDNFDYSANWVGVDHGIYRGKKLIIEIPINANEDFLGGNNVPTNEETSGVYSASGELAGKFPEPDVDVEVDIINPAFKTGKIYVSEKAVVPHIANVGHFFYQPYDENGVPKVDGNGDPVWEETVFDGINNKYVNVIYTISDKPFTKNGDVYTTEGAIKTLTFPAGKAHTVESEAHDGNTSLWTGDLEIKPALTADTSYYILVQVQPTKAPTEEGEYSATFTEKTGTIEVYKPHITFKDSSMDLGQTANYEGADVSNPVAKNYVSVEWYHGAKLPANKANESEMGKAPDLHYTYSPAAAAFTEETPVKVTGITATAVTSGNTGHYTHEVDTTMDLLTHTTFYREGCDFKGCDQCNKGTVKVTHLNDDGTVKEVYTNFIVHLNTFDLTISKEGADLTLDPNQTFIFRVTADGFSMDVTVVGNGSVTIKGLKAGEYTVTELTDWSWRYNPTENDISASAADADNFGVTTVTFTNTRNKAQWLDGNDYRENSFAAVTANS